MTVLGDETLAGDERCKDNSSRVANREVLVPEITRLTIKQTTAHWACELDKAQVPYGPINDTEAVFKDPQVQARKMAIDLPHAEYGSVPGVASPIRLSQTPPTYHSAPPSLGADTLDILQNKLKLSDNDCNTLLQAGVCVARLADGTTDI